MFLSLSLSFRALAFLKKTCQLFYRMFLSVGLSGVSSWWNASVIHWRPEYHKADTVSFSGYRIWRHRRPICPSLLMLILITQSRCYPVSSLYNYYFPFATNKHSVGRHIIPSKYPAPISPLKFSNYWWFLPEIIFIVIIAK